MKTLVTTFGLGLLGLFPGIALAHGGHAPLPDPTHALGHTVPILSGAVLVVALIALVAQQRWRP